MEQGPEQNKTEEATPFKLRRARKQGSVARGIDLGFFSAMSGFAIFAAVFADDAIARLAVAQGREGPIPQGDALRWHGSGH